GVQGMKNAPKAALVLAVAVICFHLPPSGAAAWSGDWPSADPETQGMSSNRLQALWSDLKERHSTAFLVIRNDRIVFEAYAQGYSRAKPHYTASMAKALVGGASLMLAMNDGRISPDDAASRYIPLWADHPLKKQILIRHLATHTSGIEDAEADQIAHDKLAGWKGDFWKRLPPPRDPFSIARDVAPAMEAPGLRPRYSNPG